MQIKNLNVNFLHGRCIFLVINPINYLIICSLQLQVVTFKCEVSDHWIKSKH